MRTLPTVTTQTTDSLACTTWCCQTVALRTVLSGWRGSWIRALPDTVRPYAVYGWRDAVGLDPTGMPPPMGGLVSRYVVRPWPFAHITINLVYRQGGSMLGAASSPQSRRQIRVLFLRDRPCVERQAGGRGILYCWRWEASLPILQGDVIFCLPSADMRILECAIYRLLGGGGRSMACLARLAHGCK